MNIAEVYRIIYHGPEDHLRGAVVVCDLETGFQFLFKDPSLDCYDPRDLFLEFCDFEKYVEADKNSNPSSQPRIKSQGHIKLTGPTEASIGVMPNFTLAFFLFGDIQHTMSIDKPDGSQDFSVPLKRHMLSDNGARLFTILYAYFENAVEAHVKVKLSNVTSPFDLFGVIVARTSAIKNPAYSSVLFLKEHSEKIEVKSEDGDDGNEIFISLSRGIVGVPLGCQLILQFGLCSGNDKIVEHYEAIDVTEDEIRSKTIRSIPCCNSCAVEVQINWKNSREFKSF